LQYSYRKSTHAYLLSVNKIGDFVRKIIHKSRSAPTTHTKIRDKHTGDLRDCVNEHEELIATQEFHGHWMGNSSAKEICAFATVREEGNLGFRGVDLTPDRVVTLKDVDKLIHNGGKLSKEIKTAFVKAHGSHVSNLFRPPQIDLRELFYPFYFTDKNGTMNEEEMVEKIFWKAIASVPSKARFDGFQLAVIGRFGQRWQKLLLKIIKLLLVMRYIPESLKKISRFPIPKPGKVNEYRPISLCHDLYCFLNGVITTYSSAGIERARILHAGLVAYRKGKGCHSLVTVEQSFREDCLESEYPTVQLDEDEEKFFDRVPVAILLAAMRVNGFPEQGYIEFKASAMGAKEVEIVTCKGTAYATFICGLEQGNPDSPTVANLVIKFKHDVWDVVSKEIRKIFQKQKKFNNEKYAFNSVDKLDGNVIICKIGYCDDNSKFIRVENEEDLIILVQHYLQMAGDLSMTTKIGRKGTKCDIQFFNISAHLTLKLTKCTSIAWSFMQDAPIKETVPFRVHMKPTELKKLKIMIDYDGLNLDEQIKWDKIIHSAPHRHLGLIGNLSGDTTATSTYFIQKMKERLAKLKVYNMQKIPQIKCINMLINTMHSYIPLQANHRSEDLMDFDNLVLNTIKKSHGLTCSDAKHRIFLPHKHGGCGLTSATEIDIISVARELEIVSNSGDLDSFAFRTRIAAIHNHDYDTNNALHNHARCAIRKLSRYGIHFRDSSDGLINDILRHLEKQCKYATIGSDRYSNGNGHNVGIGKECNHLLAYGGVVYKLLIKLHKNRWNISKMENNCDAKSPIKLKEIASILPRIKLEKIQNISATFSCWEWISNSIITPDNLNMVDTPKVDSIWKTISPSNNLSTFIKDTSWDEDIESSIMEQVCKLLSTVKAKDFISRSPLSTNTVGVQGYTKYADVFNTILRSESPIIMATDGSCRPKEENSHRTSIRASSAFTIGILDIRKNQSMDSREWTNRPIIPLLCRISALPNMMGASETDIAVAECHAFLMEELCLPTFLPRIIITDSEAIRDQVIHARDLFDGEINRKFIRSQIGGISKSIMGNLAKILRKNSREKSMEDITQNFPAASTVIRLLKQRNKNFLNIAETWTIKPKIISPDLNSFDHNEEYQEVAEELLNKGGHTSNREANVWRRDHFEDNEFKPILKVNSHQLCEKGLQIKNKPRYPTLSPNLCLLNANHIADTIAEFPFLPQFLKVAKSLHRVYNPPSPLRFFITLNGNTVDKHISDAINNTFIQERIKRLKTKSTQGLLWRLIQYVSDDWNSLNLHRGLLRSLLGLSRTHTRCLYKSGAYREGLWASYTSPLPEDKPPTKKLKASKIEQIRILSPCKWCPISTSIKLEHGNRMHALNNCGHSDLAQFRSQADLLLVRKFQDLFHKLQGYTSDCHVRNLLYQVQNIFIQLQTSQKGRLKRISPTINNTYLSIECLLAKHNADNLLQCVLEPTSNLCLAIFGLLPHNVTRIYNNDENIGVVDAPWLGLVPKEVDSFMQNNLQQCRTSVNNLSGDTPDSCELIDMWNCIKGIIMGRAAGLHKVIGTVSTANEKQLRATFDIETGTRRELRKQASPPKRINGKSPDHPSTPTICPECPTAASKGMLFRPSSIILDTCQGISCNRNMKEWQIFKPFTPNKIKHKTKHCLRCSKFCTIFQIGSDTLKNMLQEVNSTSQDKLINMISTSALHNPSYPPLMNVLNNFLPKRKIKDKAIYTKRSKISDQHKNLCRIFIQAYLIASTKGIDKSDVLPAIQNLLHTTLSTNNKSLALNKEKSKIREDTVQHLLHDCEKHNLNHRRTVQIALSKDDPTPCKRSDINNGYQKFEPSNSTHPTVIILEDDSISQESTSSASIQNEQEREQRRYYLNEALSENGGFLSSMGVMRAIEVFRNEALQNHFFASAESSSILNAWSPTEGWERAARIFGSRRVLTSKPNGIYFIPIFDEGHWTLAVINKIGRFKKAYMIDSLGSSSHKLTVNTKIEDFFKVKGGRFEWNTCISVRQQEYECGLRMITSIIRMVTALREGVTFEECVQRATLQEEYVGETRYNSMDIRREAARVIAKYDHTMWTGPVRLRESQNEMREGSHGISKKRKRTRNKKRK